MLRSKSYSIPIKRNGFLRGTVVNIWEGILVEDNGHLAEMTEAFLIGRQKICSAERTMLVHGKNSKIISLDVVIETV
jgi:hypothetical protein